MTFARRIPSVLSLSRQFDVLVHLRIAGGRAMTVIASLNPASRRATASGASSAISSRRAQGLLKHGAVEHLHEL